MNEEGQKETKILDGLRVIELSEYHIPLCCKEGWESCIHVVQKQKKIKQNIGL